MNYSYLYSLPIILWCSFLIIILVYFLFNINFIAKHLYIIRTIMKQEFIITYFYNKKIYKNTVFHLTYYYETKIIKIVFLKEKYSEIIDLKNLNIYSNFTSYIFTKNILKTIKKYG